MMRIYTWLSPKTNCTRKDEHHIYKSLGYSRKGFPHVPPNVLDIALVQVPAPPINGASANRRHLAGTERPPPPRPLTGVYLGPSSASRAHLEPQRVPHEQNAGTCGPIKTPCVRASDRGRVFPSFGSTPSKHRASIGSRSGVAPPINPRKHDAGTMQARGNRHHLLRCDLPLALKLHCFASSSRSC